MMRVPMVKTDDGWGPDLPEEFVGTATLTEDGDYLLTPEDSAERIAALEAEVAELRQRTETVERDVTAVRTAEAR